MADDPKPEPKTKKVRVLTDIRHRGKPVTHNSVVEMTNEEIKAHAGAVDPHPDAVAYAERQAAKAARAAAAAKGVDLDEDDE